MAGAGMSGGLNPFEDYEFQGFAGVDNCDYCDSFTHVNEWLRGFDGGIVYVCNKCQTNKRFPEAVKKNG